MSLHRSYVPEVYGLQGKPPRKKGEIAPKIKTDIVNPCYERIVKESDISVEIRLYADYVFSKDSHERHIRFDGPAINHVIGTGPGLVIFKSEKVGIAAECSRKDLRKGDKKQREIDLDQHKYGPFLTFKLP